MVVSQLPYSASTAEFISYKIWNVKIITNRGFGGIRKEKTHSLVAWTSS